jgi:S-DNA-T family DNA segregation ATPase FtsK/SpoIIIE
MVLMVNTKGAFKEFLLPAINNADYSIGLHKDIFGLNEDIVIYLEVLDNVWRFVKTEEYLLVKDKNEYDKGNLNDGDLYDLYFEGEKILTILAVASSHSFSVFQKYDITNVSEIIIGKSNSNAIQFNSFSLVSRNHARIKKTGSGFVLEDLSANGTFIDSKRILGSHELKFGDCINIFGLHLVYLEQVLAVSATCGTLTVDNDILKPYNINLDSKDNEVTQQSNNKKKYFSRSPRSIPGIYKEPIEIEAPPNKKQTKQRPLFMTIGPAFTMAIPMLLGSGIAIFSMNSSGNSANAFMYTGLITAVSSAFIGVAWAILNIRYSKKEEKEEEEYRFQAYGNYLVEIADFIKEKYEENANALRETYLSSKDYITYTEKTPFLWNRNKNHDDFLLERLGIGAIPFQAMITVPKKRFTLIRDTLSDKPGMILENYKMLQDVPIGIDLLYHQLIGVIGGVDKKGSIAVIHNLVTQIAANNCYTDVKMAFIYDEKNNEDKDNWAFAKWLPHVWSEDKRTRYVASNPLEASDVFYELTNVLRIRAESADAFHKKKFVKPHYILIISSPELLDGELIAKYVLEPKEDYGLTTLLLAEKYEDLPNSCEDIIQNDEFYKGIYSALDGDKDKKEVRFDEIDCKELELFARNLSHVEVNEIESSQDMPNSLDFFEMYGVTSLKELQILDRWRKNRTYDSMRALIGKKSGGNDCYLDIHEKYHGPHGLIAGTTGSGKSETLQTYMLSLAINYSPYDIGFFIIDFKGGGMANLFSDLPHMIGQISNLSGNQVRRAMVSIKSENMRRQRIFSEYGVNNINLYTRLLKNKEASIPIPHLFIIIDEFAELKREEPDFMRELISVAQVGRSLGVHLILATQKPSGTVDDNIWSNSKFRLCLRVQDRQDSNDMLHKPDAAYITQSGRCYLQVGNDEIYELFQSGYSGAPYDENITNHSNIATMLTITGKAALVGSRTKIKQKEASRMIWLKSLVHCINDAAKQLGIKPTESQNKPDILKNLVSLTYTYLENAGFDYGDSKYNRLRLEDFIMLWPDELVDTEEIVQIIIEKASIEGKKLPELREKTQLDAVVEHLSELSSKNGFTHNLQLWLPVLPEYLYLKELYGYIQSSFNGTEWIDNKGQYTLQAIVGLIDDPVNQSQMPLIVNLAENGHHAICGTVVSGKSTFLQTLIFSLVNRYAPDHVNLYMLDFSSRMLAAFEGLSHVGGVMYENDFDKIEKFFNMISSILEERKLLFRGGNYSQYVKVNGIVVPSIVVVIDNYANFKEKTENIYEDILIKLSRDGVSYGIYLVISAAGFGSTEIQSRIGDNIRTVICLEMGDKFKYAEAMRTMHLDVLPESDVRGRGLAQIGASILEFHTALALEAEDDYKRSELIGECCKAMNQVYKGRRAKRVPEIPENPVLSEFSQLDDYIEAVKEDRYLPYAYNMEDASIYSVDLSDTYCYLISGKARTGKTNLMKVFIHSASCKDSEVCIFEKGSNQLKKISDSIGATYVDTDQGMFEYWKSITEIFVKRNKLKRSMMEEGLDDYEIYEKIQSEKPIFLFIADLTDFVESIYSPSEGVGNMSGFMENITEKGRLHNIYFFACHDVDNVARVYGQRVYSNITGYKAGVHLGGNIASQRIFSFNNIPYMEQGKSLKIGIGLTPLKEDETFGRKVVIPLARG